MSNPFFTLKFFRVNNVHCSPFTSLQKPVSPLKMSNNIFLPILFRGQATEAEKAAFHDIMTRS